MTSEKSDASVRPSASDRDAGWVTDNRAAWNALAKLHPETAFYDLSGFRAGKDSLNPVEVAQLGDVRDKSLLHLQCHFGLDTLSWARRGARVTGLDFSDQAIRTAESLADELHVPARFVCANVYDAARVLGTQFDLVYTSYGALCWLPDLEAWARTVRACLVPGGRLHVVEFHPLLWMLDDALTHVVHPYSTRGLPIVSENQGSYADPRADLKLTQHVFNHSLGDILSAVLAAGLTLRGFQEHYATPYDIFPDMVPVPGGLSPRKWQGKAPMLFSLEAQA